nr:hypothetical protein [Afipia broomeae]
MPRHPQKPPFEIKWKQLAEEARAEADRLPHGRARDALLKKARQLETACRMTEWVSSPGLRPPVDMTKLKP